MNRTVGMTQLTKQTWLKIQEIVSINRFVA